MSIEQVEKPSTQRLEAAQPPLYGSLDMSQFSRPPQATPETLPQLALLDREGAIGRCKTGSDVEACIKSVNRQIRA